jgi:hypothetical protein
LLGVSKLSLAATSSGVLNVSKLCVFISGVEVSVFCKDLAGRLAGLKSLSMPYIIANAYVNPTD